MGARSSQSRGPGLNETDGHLLEYFRNTFSGGGGGNSGPSADPGAQGITATGGTINDYTQGGKHYRSHTFVVSGTLSVSAAVDGDVEYRILQFLFLLPGDVSNTVDERVVPSLETFLRHVQSGI